MEARDLDARRAGNRRVGWRAAVAEIVPSADVAATALVRVMLPPVLGRARRRALVSANVTPRCKTHSIWCRLAAVARETGLALRPTATTPAATTTAPALGDHVIERLVEIHC